DPTFLTSISPLGDANLGLIIPRSHFEEVGEQGFAADPIGSGPYRLLEAVSGSHVSLERVLDEHFAFGNPRFDRVVLRLVTEETSRRQMLEVGDAHFVNIGLDAVTEIEDSGSFALHQHAGENVLQLILQSYREGEVTQDIRVREAISLAIDREAISTQLL